MNTNKKLKLTVYLGIAGTLLMFAGDMLLYFTTSPIPDIDNGLLISMGEIPFGRLVIGGMIGPLAAILYTAGFYHLLLRVEKTSRKVSWLVFSILTISMIIGGAYHAFFPAFGVVSAQGHPEIIPNLLSYAVLLAAVSFSLMGIGWILLCVLVLQKKTSLPRWIVFITPLTTIWLISIWNMLTQPLDIVIAGGWYNLMHTIVFMAAMLTLKNNRHTAKV